MDFYYRPTHYDHSLNIYLYSYYGRTTFAAKLWKHDDSGSGELAITDWPFPNSENRDDQAKYDYVSAVHNSHSLTVAHEALLACKPDCIVLISVSFMEEDHYNAAEQQNGEDSFVLVASSLYTEINNNQKLEFSLHDTDSKYFFYDLARLLGR